MENKLAKDLVKIVVEFDFKNEGRCFDQRVIDTVRHHIGLDHLGDDSAYVGKSGVRWFDYPREIMEKERWSDLIPAAQPASEPHDPEDELRSPEKYIAVNGVRRVGWFVGTRNKILADHYRVIRAVAFQKGVFEEMGLAYDKELMHRIMLKKIDQKELRQFFKALPPPDEDNNEDD